MSVVKAGPRPREYSKSSELGYLPLSLKRVKSEHRITEKTMLVIRNFKKNKSIYK